MYFTPEDASLYADVVDTIDGVTYNNRIKINGSGGGVHIKEVVILPNEWVDNKYVFTESDANKYEILVQLNESVLSTYSEENQFKIQVAALNAHIDIKTNENEVNNIQVICNNETPSIEIPLLFTFMKKE